MSESNLNDLLSGFRVIEDNSMVEDGEPYKVKRTLKDRLFSRPWKPLKTQRTVVPKKPKRVALTIGNTLIVHPEMAKEFRELIAKAR